MEAIEDIKMASVYFKANKNPCDTFNLCDTKLVQNNHTRKFWPKNWFWSIWISPYLTPILEILGTSGSIISGQKIQSYFIGFDDVKMTEHFLFHDDLELRQ